MTRRWLTRWHRRLAGNIPHMTWSHHLRPIPLLQRFPAADLLPPAWRARVAPESCHVFNPAITAHTDGWVMAYRVVLPDQRRRIAICRLDGTGHVRPGSAQPLSDQLVDGGDWHADPRFCREGDRLLLHFNSGAREPSNIFLVELHATTLCPIGPCRPLQLLGPRRPVEKNWMLFFHDEILWAVYTIAPHRVLRLSLDGSGPIRCTSVYETSWNDRRYRERYGEPRGGTPPVRVGNRYYTFFHSHYRKPPITRWLTALRHGTSPRAVTYGVGCYAFAAEPPFAPVAYSPGLLFRTPIRGGSPRPPLSRYYDGCLYPSGAVHRDRAWYISVGLHDDGCALLHLSHDELEHTLIPAAEDMTSCNP